MPALQTRIVTLQPVTSATPCAAADENDLINRVIPERLVGYLQLPLSTVIVQSGTPGPDDTASVWLQTDVSGQPLGWFIYYNGQWVRVGDDPEQPGAVKWVDTGTISAADYCTANPAWQEFSPPITQTFGTVTLAAIRYVGLP